MSKQTTKTEKPVMSIRTTIVYFPEKLGGFDRINCQDVETNVVKLLETVSDFVVNIHHPDIAAVVYKHFSGIHIDIQNPHENMLDIVKTNAPDFMLLSYLVETMAFSDLVVIAGPLYQSYDIEENNQDKYLAYRKILKRLCKTQSIPCMNAESKMISNADHVRTAIQNILDKYIESVMS